MKRWMKIALWTAFSLTIIFTLIAVKGRMNENLLQNPVVQISIQDENAFLTEAELLTRLKQNNFLYVGQTVGELNTSGIEHFIDSMAEVKTVSVYTHFDGSWNIDLELRKPIVRIFNKYGESFYLDSDGFTMKVSPLHTARVLVATGDIEDRHSPISVSEIINNDSLISIRKLDDVYRISNYVCNDPLMHALIGQIHRKSNGDFVLIPMVGGQQIIFGTAFTVEEVEEKFKKLKVFYKEAIPYEGWNKYSEISLKYDQQIVCKKKE